MFTSRVWLAAAVLVPVLAGCDFLKSQDSKGASESQGARTAPEDPTSEKAKEDLDAAKLEKPKAPPDPWGFKVFSTPEGRFSVLMPGTPERKEFKAQDLIGVNYGVIVPKGAFAVGYVDLPKGRPFSRDGAVEGLRAEHQGKIVSKKNIFLYGGTGLEFEIASSQPKGYVSGLVFAVGNRHFQVIAMGDDARLTKPEVLRFLNSFHYK